MSREACDAVVAAVLGDIDALVALEKEFPATDRIARRSWRRFLSKPGTIIVCREGEHLVAAAVLLFRKTSKVARIYSIAVAQHARGKGYAQALLASCEQSARGRACTDLSLEVRLSNQAAIGLYERYGFVRIGSIAGYYDDGEDALKMRKVLGEEQT